MITKWRVPIESYVIVEAETPDEAKREVIARQEAILKPEAIRTPVRHEIEEDLLLNAVIGTITAEDYE